ncbi:MAG: phenylalanine--tRNA ligase subunit beta [Syntrophomonadaceae bacterium]|nr:phenylalanine--tRNA ligase subunit beta [Syntrophomonadaceae bacterium]MDD4548989.1 phenylalanine--tRNA ligase subunit beta [Syntrophomonadaceae bacterium]
MGISVKWLKKYVDFNWTPEELAHNLTMGGIAIEGVEKIDGDAILELDLTPNRGDCQGLINIAREVAALTAAELKIPAVNIAESSANINDYISVEIDAPDLCKRYTARLVKNCKIMPSPEWLQEALINSGIRPINNIVDITNYVLLETNQPLHAFDYNLLSDEKRILVRRAKNNEKFTTLDEVERKLDEDMLVITDGVRPVALAGIMGGLNTEINDDTTDVLIESAYFMGGNIRKTSRKLALRTDSSVRFEKGLDINGIVYALNRAAQLMQELAEGEVVGGICDAYPELQEQLQVALRPERVNYLLGTEITPQEIKHYLRKLGLQMSEVDGTFLVEIPSYRPDITMEVDLIEEVARLYGYDNIPSSLPYGNTTQGGLSAFQKFRDTVKNILANYLHEVVNYSFINPVAFDRLSLPADSSLREVIKVANPLSEEQSVMRTLLLPGLLENISKNLARKNENLAFFEMGKVFYPSQESLPVEQEKIGAVVCGTSEINWLKNKVEMDFFYLKGIIEDLLAQLGIEKCEFVQAEKNAYHPGRTALLLCGNKKIGVLGEVHPEILQNFDIKTRCCACELDIQVLFELSHGKKMLQQITRYPSVERDIAVLLDREIKASEAITIIKEAEQELLSGIVVFDIYTGEQISEGLKSMAFKLTFQSKERTLTEDEINTSIDNILQNLKTRLQAQLR